MAARKLLDKLHSQLESREPISLESATLTALQLAGAIDASEFQLYFEMQIRGFDESQKLYPSDRLWSGDINRLKWQPAVAFAEDRTIKNGQIQGHSLEKLLFFLSEPQVQNDQQMKLEISNLLSKLRTRLNIFAAHASKILIKSERREGSKGANVFIGHGHSAAWKDLKDFVQYRLCLRWDEFNRVSIAGITNTVRLSQMLDDAAIALLVMTGEDEQVDGTARARMNVIHEAGLFQGRLGFEKAIVILEEGCEEFSNILGLGQIRFPQGKIRDSFEEVRQLMEREGLLSRPAATQSS